MDTKSKPKRSGAGFKARRARLTRQQQLAKLLERKSGATIQQIQAAFGWQPHTAQAAPSTLRKAGFAVVRADTDNGAVYRIAKEV